MFKEILTFLDLIIDIRTDVRTEGRTHPNYRKASLLKISTSSPHKFLLCKFITKINNNFICLF